MFCVPLAAPSNGPCPGLLVSGRQETPFTLHEVEAVTLLTDIAASHLRHAREHEAMSGMVGRLQRAPLSEPGRPHPNLDVAIRYLPAGHNTLIGADWCETSGSISAAPSSSSATSWGTDWRPPST